MEMDEELLLGSPPTRRRPRWNFERACVMIDAARIIIITVGARALVADDNIIQVKAHTCGNNAADDNPTCIF